MGVKRGSKAQLWSKRIAAFEGSGLSRRAWCRRKGLNLATMRYWISRLPKSGLARVPIVVARDETGVADVEITLRSGLRVRTPRGTDASWLADLVRALSC